MTKSLYHTFQGSLPKRVKIYDKRDFNWFNVPRSDFVERIFDRKYDAVVDMHPFFNLASAYLTFLSDVINFPLLGRDKDMVRLLKPVKVPISKILFPLILILANFLDFYFRHVQSYRYI